MYRNPGIVVARTLGLSLSLLGLLLALALPGTPVALGAGDVNQGVCPNEGNTGFSAELPDCRAYEQVTPTYKDGFPVGLREMVGGELLQAASYGLFAGAIEYSVLSENKYALMRTPGGWVTKALNDAPLTEFGYTAGGNILLAAEGASLVQWHPSSGSIYERDLYIQEPDGTVALVGPMLPPSAVPPTPTGSGEFGFGQGPNFIGATKRFSHVLFTLRATSNTETPGVATDLWPSDTTHLAGGSSLYEYTGVDNTQPALVGVDNSGHLISDCGTEPGGVGEGASGNHFNVISESGSRVFFTAVGKGEPVEKQCVGATTAPPVDELFVRENGSHTIAISEPAALSSSEPEPDEGCTTTVCGKNLAETANFRDANFEKASRDGSKVFFSSTQQLLNNATQDSEPEDSAVPRFGQKGCVNTKGPSGCNLYEYDFDENPVTPHKPVGLVLVSGGDSSGLGPEVQGVAAVSEDGSHVYFVAKGELTKTPNEYGRSAIAGKNNLYVFDAASRETQFVATLGQPDASEWTFNGSPASGAGPMNVTDDGRVLVFTSDEHLVAGDSSTVRQVFRYDVVTGSLVRVSLANEGHDGVGASTIASRLSSESEPIEGDSHPAVSEDGAIVVFSSSEALVRGALDNECIAESDGECVEYAKNIYEYREGHVYLISHGRASPEGPFISPSGEDIFFTSTERLVPQDTDTLADFYDARVGGGFVTPSPVECSGEGCQGPANAAPVFGAPASATFTGSSNPAPPLQVTTNTPKKVVIKCSKGRKRSHGKCMTSKARSRKANIKRVKSHKGGR